MNKITTFLFAIGLFLPVLVFARAGVGVDTGKIRVADELQPGAAHTLAPITVVNTGDEPSGYEFGIQYHSGQESNPEMGLRPPREWFFFTPEVFDLEPGARQRVEVTLRLPSGLAAKPGQYFAYLEARPVRKAAAGEGVAARIGIAAATKLWFTVVPANIWQKIYWDIRDFYAFYGFWINLAAGIIFLAIAVALLRRVFRFNIGLRR